MLKLLQWIGIAEYSSRIMILANTDSLWLFLQSQKAINCTCCFWYAVSGWILDSSRMEPAKRTEVDCFKTNKKKKRKHSDDSHSTAKLEKNVSSPLNTYQSQKA